MINKIYNVLKDVSEECNYLIRPKKFPGISFHFFNDKATFYGNGVEKRNFISIQVDLWDKTTENKDRVKEIINKMKANNMRYSRKNETYESEVDLYHTVIIFNYYYKEVEDE